MAFGSLIISKMFIRMSRKTVSPLEQSGGLNAVKEETRN